MSGKGSPQPDLERLAKLLGMLGSAHEGERANAARMVDKWAREAGCSWPELFQALTAPTPPAVVTVGGKSAPEATPPPQPPPPPPPPPPNGNLGSWQAVATTILNHYLAVLRNVGSGHNDELDFVQGLLRKGRPHLSDAQQRWLRDIGNRAGVWWP